MESRRFVYILRSETHPNRHYVYVGLTSDVDRCLHWHNNNPFSPARQTGGIATCLLAAAFCIPEPTIACVVSPE